MLKGRIAFQRDLDRLDERAKKELMKDKSKVLYLGQTNCLQQYGLGTDPGERICQTGAGGAGGQWAKQELAVCPDRRVGWQHPGLC